MNEATDFTILTNQRSMSADVNEQMFAMTKKKTDCYNELYNT